jgi:hypothetical protein
MAGGQHLDVRIKKFAFRRGAPLQIGGDGFGGDHPRRPDEDLHFRGGAEAFRIGREVKRFNSEAVARQEELAPRRVVNRERKHPLETINHAVAPARIALQKSFRIARAPPIYVRPQLLA